MHISFRNSAGCELDQVKVKSLAEAKQKLLAMIKDATLSVNDQFVIVGTEAEEEKFN